MEDYGKLSMEELRKLCKKEYYLGFQIKMHHLMLYITKPLLRTNITPNQITMVWLGLEILAAFLLTFGLYKLNLIAILLYTLAGLLDYIDGQKARIKKISTYKGIWLEDMGNYFGSPLFFLGLSIGLTRVYGDSFYFILGAISAICFLYSKLCIINPSAYGRDKRTTLMKVRKKASTRPKKKWLAYSALIFRRSNQLNFLFWGIIFNIPRITLIIYTILYVLLMLRTLISQARALYHLDLVKENEQQ